MSKLRNSIVAVCCILFAFSAKADYQSWMMKFEVKTTDGATQLLYQSKALAYIDSDSLNNEHYVMGMVYTMNQNFGDTVHFYQALFKYQYQLAESEYKTTVFQLLDETVFLKSEIASIRFLSYNETTYAMGLLNNLTSSDTNWMKKPAKSHKSYDGNMCIWEVLVHQPSKEINTILAELDDLDRRYSAMQTKIEVEIENNPENREALEKRLEQFLETKGDAFYEKLEQLSDTKAIVVSFCSC